MRRFLVSIAGVLLGATIAKELQSQVKAAGCVLVPGCLFTDPKVVYGDQLGEVMLSAKVEVDDYVLGEGWRDAEMTPAFIADYIKAAGELWVSRGDMFEPTDVRVELKAA